MEQTKQSLITGRNAEKRKDIESLLRDVSRKHGFILVNFSPCEYQNAYSLYDEQSIEYQTRVNKDGRKTIIKTYPVAARMLIGNQKSETFYIDDGEVPVYCADDYYKDYFGGYSRITKLSSDLQDALGSKFTPESPDLTISGAHELYDPLSKRILQYFMDSDSL